MTIVSVNELQMGMALGADAILDNGRVLLRSGVVLEEKHIKMLKAWGLVGAEIKGITQEQLEQEALNDLNPDILENVREELSSLFCHMDMTHPMIRELHRLLVRKRTQERQQ